MAANLGQFLPLVLMIAAVWLLLVRPQQKRAKDQAEMLSRLVEGAEIVTIGGIYGTIVELGEERLLIEVADGSRLEIARRAVGSVVKKDAALEEADVDDGPDMADDADSDEQTPGDA
jgi:preprotein translocase subunit YajC